MAEVDMRDILPAHHSQHHHGKNSDPETHASFHPSKAENTDKQAIARIFGKYESELIAFAMRLTHNNSHDANDLVQDAFVRFTRATQLDGERLGKTARSYLYTVVRNLFLDKVRSEQRRPTLPLDMNVTNPEFDAVTRKDPKAVNPLDELIRSEEVDTVRAGINDLAIEQRDVIQRLYIDQVPYKTYSDESDTEMGTVKSRAHAAKAHLKEILKDRGVA